MMKKFAKAAAAALISAASAFTASFPALAGAPKPIEYNGEKYVWISGVERLIVDKSGDLIEMTDAYPETGTNPLAKIKNISELEYIGTMTGSGTQAETKCYRDGDVIITVWKSNASLYPDADMLLGKYSGDMFYECELFCKKSCTLKIIDGKTYCVDANGVTVTGWREISGKKYYFMKTGEMATRSMIIGGVRYRFAPDGVCRGAYTGWTSSSIGRMYWKDGKKQTGWLTLGGKKYYLSGGTGRMITGYLITDGNVYHFDDDGVWDGTKMTYAEYRKIQDKAGSTAHDDPGEESSAAPAKAKKISALYEQTGFCVISDDGAYYVNIENEPSWRGTAFTKGAYICEIKYVTKENDLSRIKAGSANLLPAGTKLYRSNENKNVILAETGGKLIPYARAVEG